MTKKSTKHRVRPIVPSEQVEESSSTKRQQSATSSSKSKNKPTIAAGAITVAGGGGNGVVYFDPEPVPGPPSPHKRQQKMHQEPPPPSHQINAPSPGVVARKKRATRSSSDSSTAASLKPPKRPQEEHVAKGGTHPVDDKRASEKTHASTIVSSQTQQTQLSPKRKKKADASSSHKSKKSSPTKSKKPSPKKSKRDKDPISASDGIVGPPPLTNPSPRSEPNKKKELSNSSPKKKTGSHDDQPHESKDTKSPKNSKKSRHHHHHHHHSKMTDDTHDVLPVPEDHKTKSPKRSKTSRHSESPPRSSDDGGHKKTSSRMATRTQSPPKATSPKSTSETKKKKKKKKKKTKDEKQSPPLVSEPTMEEPLYESRHEGNHGPAFANKKEENNREDRHASGIYGRTYQDQQATPKIGFDVVDCLEDGSRLLHRNHGLSKYGRTYSSGRFQSNDVQSKRDLGIYGRSYQDQQLQQQGVYGRTFNDQQMYKNDDLHHESLQRQLGGLNDEASCYYLHQLRRLRHVLKGGDNVEYQRARLKLYREFEQEAQQSAAKIVQHFQGHPLSPDLTTLTGGMAGGEKFVKGHRIFFKAARLANPDINKIYDGNHEEAIKSSSREVQFLRALEEEQVSFQQEDGEESFCLVPLSTLVDLHGFRVCCLSYFPICPNTRLLPRDCMPVLEKVASAFRLRETPADLEVHKLPSTGEIVLIDVARLLPLEVMDDDSSNQGFQLVSQSAVLRPELMRQLSFKVPHFDSIYDIKNPEEKRRLMGQVQDVLNQHVVAVVKALETFELTIVDSPVTFANMQGLWNLPLSLAEHLHKFGVNVRHLGKITKSLPERTDLQPLRFVLEREMIVRAAKVLLRKEMIEQAPKTIENTPTSSVLDKQKLDWIVVGFFNRLLAAQRSDFWNSSLLPMVRKKFDYTIFSDSVKNVNLYLLCEELQQATGVFFTLNARRRMKHDCNIFNLSNQVVRQDDILEIGIRQKQITVRSLLSKLLDEATEHRGTSTRARLGLVRHLVRQLDAKEWVAKCHVLLSATITGLSERTPTSLENAWEAVTEVLNVLPKLHPWRIVARLLQVTLKLATKRPFTGNDRIAVRRLLMDPHLQLPGIRRVEALILNAEVFQKLDPSWSQDQCRESVKLLHTITGPRSMLVASLLESISTIFRPKESLEQAFAAVKEESSSSDLYYAKRLDLARICNRRSQISTTDDERKHWAAEGLFYMTRLFYITPGQPKVLDFHGQHILTELLHALGNATDSLDILILGLQCGERLWDANAQGHLMPLVASSIKLATKQNRLEDVISALTALLMVEPALWPPMDMDKYLEECDEGHLLRPVAKMLERVRSDVEEPSIGILFVRRHLSQLLDFVSSGLRSASPLSTVEEEYFIPTSVQLAVQSVGIARGLALDLKEKSTAAIGTQRGVDIILAASPIRDLPSVVLYSVVQLPERLWESPKFLHSLLAASQYAQGFIVFSLSTFRRGYVAVQSLVRVGWSIETAVDVFEELVDDLLEITLQTCLKVEKTCQALMDAVERAFMQFLSTVALVTTAPISTEYVYSSLDRLTHVLAVDVRLRNLEESLVFNIDNHYPTVCHFDEVSQQMLLSSTVWTPLHCDRCVDSVLAEGALLKVYRDALLKNELFGLPHNRNRLPTEALGVIGALPDYPYLIFQASTFMPLAETPIASLAEASVPFDARARNLRGNFENIMVSFGPLCFKGFDGVEQVKEVRFDDNDLRGVFSRHASLYDIASDLSEQVKVTVKMPKDHLLSVSALLRQYGRIVEESVEDQVATLVVKDDGELQSSNERSEEIEALQAQTTQELEVLSFVAQVADRNSWREAVALCGSVASWRRVWIEAARADNVALLSQLRDADSHFLAALAASSAAGSLKVVEHLLTSKAFDLISPDSLLVIIEDALGRDMPDVVSLFILHKEDRVRSDLDLLHLAVKHHANSCLEMLLARKWSSTLDKSFVESLLIFSMQNDNVHAALELLKHHTDVAVGGLLTISIDRSLDRVTKLLFERALSNHIDPVDWSNVLSAMVRCGRVDLLERIELVSPSTWNDLVPVALGAGYVTVADLCFNRAGCSCDVPISTLLTTSIESDDLRCVDFVLSHSEVSTTNVPWVVAVNHSTDSLDVLQRLLSRWELPTIRAAVASPEKQAEILHAISNISDRLCPERSRLLAPLLEKGALLQSAVASRNEILVDEIKSWPHVRCSKSAAIDALSGGTWNPSIAVKVAVDEIFSPHANELYEAASYDVRRLVFLSSCTGWDWTDACSLHRMAVGPSSSLRWAINAAVVQAEVGSIEPEDGDTTLHRAATAGIVENVEILLHADANVETCNYLGLTPAGSALAAGQWKLVSIFTAPERLRYRMPLSEADIPLLMSSLPISDELLAQLLSAAVASRLYDAAALVVKAGASPLVTGVADRCALTLAAEGSDIRMLDTLVKTAYAPDEVASILNNVKDRDMPLLHTAVSIRAAPVVEWLLRHGVDTSIRMDNGPGDTCMTATQLALHSRAKACYQLLVQAGAGDESQDWMHHTFGNEEYNWLLGNTPSEQGIHPRHFYERLEDLTATIARSPFDENRKRVWRKDPHMISKMMQQFIIKQSEKAPAQISDQISLLFDLGADPCWQHEEQQSLSGFHLAAVTLKHESHISSWQLLIESTPSHQIDSLLEEKNKWNPLCMACAAGNKVATAQLINAGCDAGRNDYEALSLMARHPVLQQLLIQAAPREGMTLSNTSKDRLHDTITGCAASGMLDAMKALVTCPSIDVNREGKEAPLPLLAAVGEAQKEAVELLLESGALPLKSADSYDKSPLRCAIASPHENIALLLAKSADSSSLRKTPCVSDACVSGHVKLTRFLLDLRCPMDGFSQRPAIVRAPEDGLSKTDSVARELVEILIHKGADPTVSHDDQTALGLACVNGYFKTVVTLVKNGASVNERAANGVTPLIVSIFYNHEDIALWLIRNGADVNQWSGQLQTPLLLSCGRGIPKVVKALLEHGANPNIADITGNLPIKAVVQSHNPDLIGILCKYGSELPLDDMMETAALCNLPLERFMAALPSKGNSSPTVPAPTPSPEEIAFACIQHFEDNMPELVQQCKDAIQEHPPGTNIVIEVMEGRISLKRPLKQPPEPDEDEQDPLSNPLVKFCNRTRARKLAAVARDENNLSHDATVFFWQTATMLFPCSEYANEVASIYLQAGDAAEAITWVTRALSFDLGHASHSFFLFGRLSSECLGDKAFASKCFQRAIAADPQNADARAALTALGEFSTGVSSQFEAIEGMLDSNDDIRYASMAARKLAEYLRDDDEKVERLVGLLEALLEGELGQLWRRHLQSNERYGDEVLTFNLLGMACPLVETACSPSVGDAGIENLMLLTGLSGQIFDGKLYATLAALAEVDADHVDALKDTGLSELGLRKALLLSDDKVDTAREWINARLDDTMVEYPFVKELLDEIPAEKANGLELIANQLIDQNEDSDDDSQNESVPDHPIQGPAPIESGCCVIL